VFPKTAPAVGVVVALAAPAIIEVSTGSPMFVGDPFRLKLTCTTPEIAVVQVVAEGFATTTPATRFDAAVAVLATVSTPLNSTTS